jgi:hypothetical protein
MAGDVTRLYLKGETIQVWGPEEQPDGFVWRGVSYRVEEVCNRWLVHTRWWEAGEVVWRAYYKVTAVRGALQGVAMLCELYHDLRAGEWVLARVYD